jgi:hypothetical protein
MWFENVWWQLLPCADLKQKFHQYKKYITLKKIVISIFWWFLYSHAQGNNAIDIFIVIGFLKSIFVLMVTTYIS